MHRIRRGQTLEKDDHMRGFSLAIQDALDNLGWPRGDHHAGVTLSAVVNVKNPGTIIEYHATMF